jgi:hypothetical protein
MYYASIFNPEPITGCIIGSILIPSFFDIFNLTYPTLLRFKVSLFQKRSPILAYCQNLVLYRAAPSSTPSPQTLPTHMLSDGVQLNNKVENSLSPHSSILLHRNGFPSFQQPNHMAFNHHYHPINDQSILSRQGTVTHPSDALHSYPTHVARDPSDSPTAYTVITSISLLGTLMTTIPGKIILLGTPTLSSFLLNLFLGATIKTLLLGGVMYKTGCVHQHLKPWTTSRGRLGQLVPVNYSAVGEEPAVGDGVGFNVGSGMGDDGLGSGPGIRASAASKGGTGSISMKTNGSIMSSSMDRKVGMSDIAITADHTIKVSKKAEQREEYERAQIRLRQLALVHITSTIATWGSIVLAVLVILIWSNTNLRPFSWIGGGSGPELTVSSVVVRGIVAWVVDIVWGVILVWCVSAPSGVVYGFSTMIPSPRKREGGTRKGMDITSIVRENSMSNSFHGEGEAKDEKRYWDPRDYILTSADLLRCIGVIGFAFGCYLFGIGRINQ